MLHLYLGSTQANRDSDDFRLREAYRALRARLDTDGMLDLNTAELPVRGLTAEALAGQASTVPFLANARVIVVEGLIVSLGAGRGVADDWQPLLDALPALPDTNHLVLLEPAPTREARTTLGRSPLLRALRALEGADVQQFEAMRLYGRGGNEVAAWLLERAKAHGVRLGVHRPLMANSDHYNFARAGVPATRLVAGFNQPDSNLRYVLTPADTRDKVQASELAGAVWLTARLVEDACRAPALELRQAGEHFPLD